MSENRFGTRAGLSVSRTDDAVLVTLLDDVTVAVPWAEFASAVAFLIDGGTAETYAWLANRANGTPSTASTLHVEAASQSPSSSEAGVTSEALDILRDMHDEEPCHFDHHGYCQEHTWLTSSAPCPHGRAQKLFATLDEEWRRAESAARFRSGRDGNYDPEPRTKPTGRRDMSETERKP